MCIIHLCVLWRFHALCSWSTHVVIFGLLISVHIHLYIEVDVAGHTYKLRNKASSSYCNIVMRKQHFFFTHHFCSPLHSPRYADFECCKILSLYIKKENCKKKANTVCFSFMTATKFEKIIIVDLHCISRRHIENKEYVQCLLLTAPVTNKAKGNISFQWGCWKSADLSTSILGPYRRSCSTHATFSRKHNCYNFGVETEEQ